MRATIPLLLAVLVARPALAAPVSFVENWDSYSAGAPPAGPWYADPHLSGRMRIFVGIAQSPPNTYEFVSTDRGDQALLLPAGQKVEATDSATLSVVYSVVANLNKGSDFYVEISLGDVHAPRMIDYPPGTPLPGVIPVLAYCKPLNSLDSGDWNNKCYIFDGRQWTASGFFDFKATYEQLSMVVDSDSAFISTSLGIENPADVPRQYLGGFDRVSIYTRDFTGTTYNLIDDLSITGGNAVPNLGACCMHDASCQDLTEPDCSLQEGYWAGGGSTCAAAVCCPYPFADTDVDGDVDHADFGAFQICYTGDGGGVPDGCACLDREPDGDVDGDDFAAFDLCWSGPNVPWAPQLAPGCNP